MNAIVSVCNGWAIGRNGGLLLRNPADMSFFVEKTTGHTLVMGRNTLESFPGGKPLKNRRNIVLSRNAHYQPEGAEVARSTDEVFELIADEASENVWLIGGAQVYALLLDSCSFAYVTRHECTVDADSYFPQLDKLDNWELSTELGSGVTDEGIPYRFELWRNTALKKTCCCDSAGA